MTSGPPRVALFADSFHEVNGVALTYRQLDAFVRRRGIPFFNCHAGPQTRVERKDSVTTFELRRGLLSFAVEKDLAVDPLLTRYKKRVRDELEKFQPDIIHIAGPNDIGLMGAWLSREMEVPLTAAWHTNVHEFAAWRLAKSLGFLPESWSKGAADVTEEKLLAIFTKLYGAAKMCFAPNPELIAMLEERTGKPVDVMRRGVDIDMYTPEKRRRDDDVFELGYVGRISTEKNVRFLKTLEDGLKASGAGPFRITVVGHGTEEEWLRRRLETGVFTGVLHGEELARAYANFDLFVFPSFTDTYGNVINEAMASGTPCIVTTGGGPKYLIKDGETGVMARDEAHFVAAVAGLMADRERHQRMRAAARAHAVENSWDRVFERLYERFGEVAGQVQEAVPVGD